MSTSSTDGPTARALDPESLTPGQRARWERIVQATVELANEGGYHGVQMRDVADRADVALGTLYRYFPSKTHLLTGALRRETEALRSRMQRRPARGETAEDRVMDVLGRATRALERSPKLTEAVLRAVMNAEADATVDSATASDNVSMLIIEAIHGNGGEPTDDERAIARVLQQVWYFSLMRWLSGRDSSRELREHLRVAIHLLLRSTG
jgi:TetR/AcrR family transcriptional regulator, cholesterol catabolism regulator